MRFRFRRISTRRSAPLHPFDRMLVSQALVEGMKLVSHDEDVIAYGDVVIAV